MYIIFEFEEGTAQTIERLYSRVHPEDLLLLQETVERSRRDGRDIEFQHRLLMPNLAVKYVNMVAPWSATAKDNWSMWEQFRM